MYNFLPLLWCEYGCDVRSPMGGKGRATFMELLQGDAGDDWYANVEVVTPCKHGTTNGLVGGARAMLGHPSEKYDFVNWEDNRNPILMGK